MARKIIHDGPVNTAVKAWMRANGIKPEDVRGYTLTYEAGGIMTIDVRMFMTDEVRPYRSARVIDGRGVRWEYDAPRDCYIEQGVDSPRHYDLDDIEAVWGVVSRE